jgi:hypothetical protein
MYTFCKERPSPKLCKLFLQGKAFSKNYKRFARKGLLINNKLLARKGLPKNDVNFLQGKAFPKTMKTFCTERPSQKSINFLQGKAFPKTM